MTKTFLITVGISGVLAVLLGTFGTSILNGNISPGKLNTWTLAVSFQMTHTIALLAITFMNRYLKRSYLNVVYYLWVIGIALYSGSLYLNAISELTGASSEATGLLRYFAPVGSILLAVGWILIIVTGITYVHHKRGHKKSSE